MKTRTARDTDQNSLYADPEVYDILHEPGTGAELRALERIAKREGVGPDAAWIEPACGSGRLVRAVAQRGRRCAGFDLSEGMIAYAARAAAKEGHAGLADFFVADMRSFDRETAARGFGVGFIPINSIRHLSSDAGMLSHLRAMRRVLLPGGIYIVGLSLCAYGLEAETEDVWRGRRGRTAVVQVIQYAPPTGSAGRARAERVVSHLTVRGPGGERHVDAAYTLRGYNLAQWRAVIEKSPFHIRSVADSDGKPAEPAEPGYYLFVLG